MATHSRGRHLKSNVYFRPLASRLILLCSVAMNWSLCRAYLVEFLGTFAVVFFAAGVVMVNHLTTPSGQTPGAGPLTGHQSGLVGIALAQGLIVAVMLGCTVPVSGGYLNPAVTIMLWVFNRLDTLRASWFIGAQVLGAVLAGLCLSRMFDAAMVQESHLGTPHINQAAYGTLPADSSRDGPMYRQGPLSHETLVAATVVEFLLTFFLVFAIFSLDPQGRQPHVAGAGAGALLSAGVLAAYPLTGAAANPARWLGTVFWEWTLNRATTASGTPWAEIFIYCGGPIIGALLAGLCVFKVVEAKK